jgi:indole-3-glycerol phosphate synthase
MSTILDTIVARKREEVAARRATTPPAALEQQAAATALPRGFARGLATVAATQPAIIAEVKRGSPSLGCIRPDLDAADQAAAYAEGGAAALSVLTDESFFFGSDADFRTARDTVSIPMLRKEFIIDPYQVWESRVLGADCILLILAILDDTQAADLSRLAGELGMDVLVETHTAAEIERAVNSVPFDLIGVNNRNLKTFNTSEETTRALAECVPDRQQLVAESGLHSPAAVARCWDLDIRRFLIGEAFVRAQQPAATVRRFVAMTHAPGPTETAQ